MDSRGGSRSLANVTRVRCKCRNWRGQTWVCRRTSARHMRSIGRDPRLRANVDVSFHLKSDPQSAHHCLHVIYMHVMNYLLSLRTPFGSGNEHGFQSQFLANLTMSRGLGLNKITHIAFIGEHPILRRALHCPLMYPNQNPGRCRKMFEVAVVDRWLNNSEVPTCAWL